MSKSMEELLRQAFQLGQQWVQETNNDNESMNFNEWYNSNEVKYMIGKIFLKMGFQYGVSTDIADFTSYGYGELDSYGFWEYPIYEKDIKLKGEGKWKTVM